MHLYKVVSMTTMFDPIADAGFPHGPLLYYYASTLFAFFEEDSEREDDHYIRIDEYFCSSRTRTLILVAITTGVISCEQREQRLR